VWKPNCNVLRCARSRQFHMVVSSTLLQVEYKEFMREVDVTDHLRSMYSMQLRSHKWWQKLCIFVFDQSITNMYIMYGERCEELCQKPLSHMLFNIAIADYLVVPQVAIRHNCRIPQQVPPGRKGCVGPELSTRRRFCVLCRRKQSAYCRGCNYTFMCAAPCF
jgi:hypothetical protein